MGAFQGHLNSGRIQNHVYTSNDESLEAIGLSSFTLDSCSKIWNSNLKNINFILNTNYKELGEQQTIISNGISIATPGVLEYYDDNNNIQVLTKTEAEWIELIVYHEDRIFNKVPSDKIKDATLKAIKKSVYGGIKFEFNKTIFAGVNSDPDPEKNKRYILLKFFTRNLEDEDNDSDKRTVGINANMPMVGLPQTPAGSPYSATNTTNIANTNNTGTKAAVSEGGSNNPTNTVAAPLDMSFNQNSGKWESGNRRIIAIILDDIDPSPVLEFPLNKDDVDSTEPTGFISTNSDYTTSFIPNSGTALPLAVQLKNKNMHSPNFVKKCIVDETGQVVKEGYKPETVTVINRFNKKFAKGDRVFLTRIDNEWIPEKVEQDLVTPQLKIGEWSFVKLITDSDNYFKDNRFLNTDNSMFTLDITPNIYENGAKVLFFNNVRTYKDMPQVETLFGYIEDDNDKDWYLKNFETNATDVPELSKRYFISTIFDQLSTEMGGFQEDSYIGKTNIFSGDIYESGPYMDEVGFFWGPVYLDGYLQLVKETTPVPAEYSLDRLYFDNTLFNKDLKETGLTITTGLNKENFTSPPLLPTYKPTNNDIPAECTSKILDCLNIFNNYDKIGTIDNKQLLNRYLYPPFAKTAKTSRNRIQFIPLSANFVGHNDPLAQELTSYDRNFFTNARSFYQAHFSISIDGDNGAWGKMFSRISSNIFTPSSLGSWPSTSSQYGNNLNCSQANTKKADRKQIVPYDCYIRKEPTNSPTGAPRSLFDDTGKFIGANCVGIICGKNIITKSSGGIVNFEVTSVFGSNPFRTVSGGQIDFSILAMGGIGIPFLNSNEVRNSPGIPQFGSKTDSITSFGTNALFIRVFNSWPEDLTVFDPRYFGVLHFNPGQFGTLAISESIEIPDPDDPNESIPISVDKIETPVDFRVPTFNDNTVAPLGTIINGANKKEFRPKNQWRVSTIRRGMLLTGGGFKYKIPKIGANTVSIFVQFDYINIQTSKMETKTWSGKGYSSGSEFSLSNGLKITITEVGGDGSIINWAINDKGDFEPSNFPNVINLPKPDGNNSEIAKLNLEDGIIYGSEAIDNPPVEHVPLTRISSSSKSGSAEINETITSTFDLSKNKTGIYDIFTHFHNDIGHTFWSSMLQNRGYFQYTNMKIT